MLDLVRSLGNVVENICFQLSGREEYERCKTNVAVVESCMWVTKKRM